MSDPIACSRGERVGKGSWRGLGRVGVGVRGALMELALIMGFNLLFTILFLV